MDFLHRNNIHIQYLMIHISSLFIFILSFKNYNFITHIITTCKIDNLSNMYTIWVLNFWSFMYCNHIGVYDMKNGEGW